MVALVVRFVTVNLNENIDYFVVGHAKLESLQVFGEQGLSPKLQRLSGSLKGADLCS